MNTKNIKTAPHSIESEQSVIGALLLYNEAWDRVADIVVESDFYDAFHRIIFNAIATLLEHEKPADMLTVKEHIKKTNPQKNGDEFAYLAQIAENTPSILNIEAYAKQVREYSVYRQLLAVSNDIADIVYQPKNMELQDIIGFSEQKIFNIGEQVTRNKKSIVSLKDIIKDVESHIKKLQSKTGISGLATGFYDLDKLTSGLQNGDLIIFAGRPSMGKTALAMNIVEYVSIESPTPKPVAIFSLEMPIEQLVMRIISSHARIDNRKLRNKMSPIDWDNFNKTISAIEKSTILVDDTPSITPTEIRAKCRRLKRQYPDLSLIVIDYLQLMVVHGKSENRNQEISEISHSLKSLARELSIPVIALSQLNRAVESRPKKNKGRMPQMSDLRDSGSIEQDADIIAFIYRDEVYHDENYSNDEEKNKADLKISKHRNGAQGLIKFTFVGEYTHFKNLAYDDQFDNIPEYTDDYDGSTSSIDDPLF